MSSEQPSEAVQSVVREGRRVWIDGVPPERMLECIWHLDGLPAALRAALRYKGVEDSYLEDTVFAAITGQPFRFWFSPYWEDCLAYTQEEPLGVGVAETLGFDCNWHPGGNAGASWQDLWERRKTLDRAAVDAAWEGMRREIDAGHPVILLGGDPNVDPKAGPVVVTGYDLDRGLIYFLSHSTWEPASAWDETAPQCQGGIADQGYRARARPDETNWVGTQFAPVDRCAMGGALVSFFALRDRGRGPSEHEVAVSILQRAASFAHGERTEPLRPHIRAGLPAFDAFIAALEQEGDRSGRNGGSMPWDRVGDWLYAMEGLVGPGLRKAASAFLGRCAAGFGGFSARQREALRAGARHYDDATRETDAFMRLVASVGPIEEYEDRLQTGRTSLSSPEFRREAAQVIGRVRTAEERAIEAAEAALAAERAG